jgi:hypothetical protein
MASPVIPVVAVHQSWLSKFGSFLGKALHFITGTGVAVEKIVVPLAETLFPQLAPAIAAGDGIFTSIVKEALAAESTMAAAGTATGTGAQKLATVVGSIGPMLDTWIANNLPGAKTVSAINKAGLVNAVVAIINDVSPAPTAPPA